MQITDNNYNKNRIFFGSKRILPVIVRDINDKPVKAWFSRLDFYNKADRAAMDQICKTWKGSPFLAELCIAFENRNLVYAIETDSKKILSLAEVAHLGCSRIFELYRILTSPDSRFRAINRKFKGAGEALMYGLVRFAEKSATIFQVGATPSAKDFYESLDMVERDEKMTFNPDEMRDFIKTQKAKWKALLQKTK